MKSWTKREIALMQSALALFVQLRRPAVGASESFTKAMNETLQAKRLKIVRACLYDLRHTAAAAKQSKEAAWYGGLLDRIAALGLPPDVVSFDPTIQRPQKCAPTPSAPRGR